MSRINVQGDMGMPDNRASSLPQGNARSQTQRPQNARQRQGSEGMPTRQQPRARDANSSQQRPMIAPVTKGDVRRSVLVGSIISITIVLVLVLGITIMSTSARNAQLQATINKANAIVEQAKSEVSLSPTKKTVQKAVDTNVNITVIKGANDTAVSKPSQNSTDIGANGSGNATSSNGSASNENGQDGNQAGNTNDSSSTNATGADSLDGTTAQQDQNAVQQDDDTNGDGSNGNNDSGSDDEDEVHGSGVVVTSDGNIVTCLHVIENAKSITVKIDGKEYPATVTGTDPTSDIATIKVDAKNLKVTQFGDSSKVNQGDWCMAVGNPYGLNDTITVGNVSATGRDISYQGQTATVLYADMLQTDATVNPGNSGGGLYDASGEMIGMVSVITTDNDNSVGIAYAIPSNLLVPIAKNLVQGKTAQHAVIGASLGDVTQDMVSKYGLTSTDGAVVTSVTPSGPADNVKITQNDIIVKYDGKEVKNAQNLLFKVRASEINQQVTLTVLRNGKEMTFNVKLGSDV